MPAALRPLSLKVEVSFVFQTPNGMWLGQPRFHAFRRTSACGLLAFTLSAYAYAGELTQPARSSTPPGLQSQDTHPYHAASQSDGAPLSIQEAMQLALTDQPIPLLNCEALATAEEQQAI